MTSPSNDNDNAPAPTSADVRSTVELGEVYAAALRADLERRIADGDLRGAPAVVAADLGISPVAVRRWRQVPERRVDEVAAAYGLETPTHSDSVADGGKADPGV